MRLRFPLLLLFVLAACDRPFVPQAEPDIRPADPEIFATVQTADSLDLRLDVTSFRAITSVTVNGIALAREAASPIWAARVPLANGVNALAVRATDAAGVVGLDTLYAARLTVVPRSELAPLPEPLGAHTATRLLDGRVLLTGGAAQAGAAASDAAFVFDGMAFTRLDARLQRPRAGHTATLLPDGRVLIAGGRTTEGSGDLTTFVGDAEIFDPQTETFSVLPVRGAPIVRAQHTALVRTINDALVLELLGGEGNVAFGSPGRFGIREDLRPFEITDTALVALTPGATSGQGSTVARLAGHLTVPLTGTPPGDTDFFVAGAYFGERGTEVVNLLLQVRTFGLNLRSATPLKTPRTEAAAVRLSEGLLLILGGATGAERTPAGAGELYASRARTAFEIPASLIYTDSRSLAAVVMAGGAVCAFGGFDAAGAALHHTRCFSLPGL